jgi:CPA1 family monovalent cation:H+ antiporter
MPPVAVVLLLLAGACLLAGGARRKGVPYPVVLVLGGVVLSLIPGVPKAQLDPDVVFYLFLPPLLYSASFLFSTEELRREAPAISVLAVVLVLATVGVVAVCAHAAAGLSWPVAFLLGAIVGPTDPVAASATVQRLGAPQRIATILEGESLVNDGTGLTAYKIALVAVGTTSVSLGGTVGRFVLVAVGGIAVGLAAGWVSTTVRRRLDDPSVEVGIAALTAFGAYAGADELGVSGVLAAVAAGLFVGARSDDIASPGARLQSAAFWTTVTFLLESTLFLLVGLQLVDVIQGLAPASAWTRIGQAAAVCGAVLGLRLAWMLAVPAALSLVRLRPSFLQRDRAWREQLVIGWSGMRGAVSLAAALAVPLTLHRHPFPDRSLVVFLTYTTILGTLVLPGLTLPLLVQRLGLAQGEERRRLDTELRLKIAHAALERLQHAAREDDLPEQAVARLDEIYQARIRRLEARTAADDAGAAADVHAAQELHRRLIEAEREALAEAEAQDGVPVDVAREIEHDLDLEHTRLNRRS